MSPISGKTVVVTGGSRGIGLGLVKEFLSRDNVVIATSRKAADATHLQQLLQQYPKHLRITDLDTSAFSSIAAWAERLKTDSGVQHVDVLVNNAGVYRPRETLDDFSEDDFLHGFQANTMGPFFVIQQLLKQGLLGSPASGEARSAGSGSLVVNMSSIMGSNGDKTLAANVSGAYAYRASKAALNVLSSTLSRDLAARGVQVLAVHPGYVKTDMTGGNGYIEVEESTQGIVGVLESGKPLNGKFLSYSGEEIPW